MSIYKETVSYQRAELSKGISHTDYVKLSKTLTAFGGTILDAGAGAGNLLNHLLKLAPSSRLAGLDILDRPSHLPEDLGWHARDINEDWNLGKQYDTVVCCQTLPHIENPWHTFREFSKAVRPGGHLVIVQPNHLSLNSILPLFSGHHFRQRKSVPDMIITQLLPLDLQQLCEKNGFKILNTYYNDTGVILHRWGISWQTISLGLLQGRWFKDEVTLIAQKVA